MSAFRHILIGLVSATLLVSGSPVAAGWKLMPARQPANLTGITVTPQSDWNQASARPGKQGRAWTHDGFWLNGLEFFAAVPNGQPLYRERNKKRNPMPKFDKGMLLPDLADFYERSFRVNSQVSDFSILESGPASFGGHSGIRVRFRYSLPNDALVRLGEARLTVVKGKLYAASYMAPELHYFPAGIGEAVALMESARF